MSTAPAAIPNRTFERRDLECARTADVPARRRHAHLAVARPPLFCRVDLAYISAIDDREYWPQKLREAEAEVAAAKRRTELNAAAHG
jgi:hypothetical protein